jgi:phosphotransferase system enzyme I (PtsI)
MYNRKIENANAYISRMRSLRMPVKPENHLKKTSEGKEIRSTPQARRIILTGVAVSSGIGIGRSQFINRYGHTRAVHRRIKPNDVPKELRRLDAAVSWLEAEFNAAKIKLSSLSREAGEQSELLDAYIMICRDPKLINSVRANINAHMNAEWALEKTVQQLLAAFSGISSPYLRERAVDIRTVISRVIQRLQGDPPSKLEWNEPRIIFAHDLTPADTLALETGRIIALVTEMGGQTSHTGILARSMHLPCVVGCLNLEECVQDGDRVIVDGINGLVILNPYETEIADYAALAGEFRRYEERIKVNSAYPAETEDGVRVPVYANVESGREASRVKALGGEGIGLFRTEFSYLSRNALPTEDEQFEEYKAAIQELAPLKVVMRTLDIGADKMINQRPKFEEPNPALGLRAIRYCLRHQDIFRRQLRALLRASVYGKAALLFPMISGLGELRQAKSILTEVKQELDNEGVSHNPHVPVGAMIELPAAVFVSRVLAREVDFFSIGTNDLIQYSLGVDRCNKNVSYLYKPLHPAVISAIKYSVDMAHAEGISVSVCGEMAADPYCLPVLLGIGVDALSMTPHQIPFVKNLIRRSNTEEFRALLGRIVNQTDPESILRLISQNVYPRFRDELAFFASMAENGN